MMIHKYRVGGEKTISGTDDRALRKIGLILMKGAVWSFPSPLRFSISFPADAARAVSRYSNACDTARAPSE